MLAGEDHERVVAHLLIPSRLLGPHIDIAPLVYLRRQVQAISFHDAVAHPGYLVGQLASVQKADRDVWILRTHHSVAALELGIGRDAEDVWVEEAELAVGF